MACGRNHTLFLSEHKKIYACGDNSHGQLGVGNKKNSLLPLKIMLLDNIFIKKICAKDFSAALTETGELYLWGDSVKNNIFPELIRISESPQKVTDVDIGKGFCLCTAENGKIYSWGSNNNGELGTEDYGFRDTFKELMTIQNVKMVNVFCGDGFAFALGEKIEGNEVKNNTNICDDIERIKERNQFKNGVLAKRSSNRQYLKSTENFPVNKAEVSENNNVMNKNDVDRNGKSLTPVRHLTSDEIRNRQKMSFHNPKKQNNSQNVSNHDLDRTEISEIPKDTENFCENNYIMNPVDAEKIKNLLKTNTDHKKENAFSKTSRCFPTKYEFDTKKIQENTQIAINPTTANV